MIEPVAMIVTAFAAYTFAVFHGRRCGIKRINLISFFAGLLFDFLGTAEMFQMAGRGISLHYHSIAGVAALFGMSTHAGLSFWAYHYQFGAVSKFLARWSTRIYTLWCVAFASGIAFGILGL